MKYLTSTAIKLAIALPLLFGVSGNALAEDEAQKKDGDEITLSKAVEDADPFIGAWSVILTNEATKIKNPALYSFLRGGVLNQSENPMVDPMLGNLVFSNAHGAWQYNTAGDSYSIRYFKLVFKADASYWGREETTGTLRFDDDGNLKGTIKVGNVTSKFVGERITAR